MDSNRPEIGKLRGEGGKRVRNGEYCSRYNDISIYNSTTKYK